MPAIFPIVEGHGELPAVPLLLRRLAHEHFELPALRCLTPFRLSRGKLRKENELSRAVNFGRLKLRDFDSPHLVLIVMDADEDCPVVMAHTLRTQHEALFATIRTSIVFAVREYEAWFLAANMNETDHQHLRAVTPVHANPEQIANPKAEFERAFLRPGLTYSESIDQPRFTACMNLTTALRASSFNKLVREIRSALIV